jgi:hypothetical protein
MRSICLIRFEFAELTASPTIFPSDWDGEVDNYPSDLLVYTRHSAFPYGKLEL